MEQSDLALTHAEGDLVLQSAVRICRTTETPSNAAFRRTGVLHGALEPRSTSPADLPVQALCTLLRVRV